mmetsp:Transcript_13940/g.33737  ORF Transcript_13940/g.33737 Transcript_13940/m.33737 type:complete len:220 (-) Transcript_13940:1721-2380(-)
MLPLESLSMNHQHQRGVEHPQHHHQPDDLRPRPDSVHTHLPGEVPLHRVGQEPGRRPQLNHKNYKHDDYDHGRDAREQEDEAEGEHELEHGFNLLLVLESGVLRLLLRVGPDRDAGGPGLFRFLPEGSILEPQHHLDEHPIGEHLSDTTDGQHPHRRQHLLTQGPDAIVANAGDHRAPRFCVLLDDHQVEESVVVVDELKREGLPYQGIHEIDLVLVVL